MTKRTESSSAIIEAHEHCTNNKSALKHDDLCGCFYCLKIFNPNEISEWIDDDFGKTAMCPYCGIDSIIGFPIVEDFLKSMKNHWF
jgi:hypothetical protein